MRIISGDKKGSKIKTKKGLSTRPLQARVKKSLFSILSEILHEAVFIDLFAGNGGVGIEALSRNAGFCWFIERDETCANILYENIKNLGFSEMAKILKLDFRKAIHILEDKDVKADIIFSGPPYDSPLAVQSLELLSLSKIIKPETIIIVETRKHNPPPETINSLTKFRSEKYGDTLLSFFRSSKP